MKSNFHLYTRIREQKLTLYFCQFTWDAWIEAYWDLRRQ